VTRPYRVHRSAAAEIRAAARWYRARSPTAAAAFLAAVETAIAAIVEHPEAWPRRDERGAVRAFVLDRFPFSIVYRIRPAEIRILAVAHAKRAPDYWRRHR
jgi:toxin ParE1/3/4